MNETAEQEWERLAWETTRMLVEAVQENVRLKQRVKELTDELLLYPRRFERLER